MSFRAPHALRVAVIAALLVVGAACSGPAEQHAAAGRVAADPPRVVTAPVTQSPFSTLVEGIGTAAAQDSVEIVVEATQRIASIHFEEGQKVPKGALLVAMDSAEARASLAAAEAMLEMSRLQLQRSQDLRAAEALSVAQLEQIEASYKERAAQADLARIRLRQMTLHAPFAGRAGLRKASVGALVAAGTPITTLDDTSVMRIDFDVAQGFIGRIEPGHPVKVHAHGLGERALAGRVAAIDPRLDSVSRSARVRAIVPNERDELRPGMYVTVVMEVDTTSSVVIPEQALVTEGDARYVYVAHEGAVARRDVAIGRRRPGEVEVLRGLQSGERVVVEGGQRLKDGAPVQDVTDELQRSAAAAG